MMNVLTPAEWRTTHAVKHGMSNREIARRRGISADAVKFHVSNALAKLGFTSRHQLRKWFRVPLGSALEGQRIDMQQLLILGSIGQISRTVSDIARAETWYGTVLGLKHLYTFGKLAFFDCDGVRLVLSVRPTRRFPPSRCFIFAWRTLGGCTRNSKPAESGSPTLRIWCTGTPMERKSGSRFSRIRRAGRSRSCRR